MTDAAEPVTPVTPEAPATVAPTADFVPAIILRNKGVPITLLRLENGQLPPVEEDEDQPTRKLFLRFNANHVSEIEEAFDGIVARVPIVRREVKKGEDGKALVGPDGPVYIETIEGYEDRVFYGLEAFQKAMEVRQVGTIRRVIAIALGYSVEEAGLAMDPGLMLEYQNAVGVAWSIAQGVDPTDAAKVLHKAAAAVAAQRANLASQLEKTMDEAEE